MTSVSPILATTLSPVRPAVASQGSVTWARSTGAVWETSPVLPLPAPEAEPPAEPDTVPDAFCPQPLRSITRAIARAPKRFLLFIVVFPFLPLES